MIKKEENIGIYYNKLHKIFDWQFFYLNNVKSDDQIDGLTEKGEDFSHFSISFSFLKKYW